MKNSELAYSAGGGAIGFIALLLIGIGGISDVAGALMFLAGMALVAWGWFRFVKRRSAKRRAARGIYK